MFTRRKAGVLKYGRNSHRVIYDGEKILVIGGDKKGEPQYPLHEDLAVKNEVCTLEGTRMKCVEQSTALVYYLNHPEPFLVGKDFGKDVNKC